MPKILKEEIAKPLAEVVISNIRMNNPDFSDAQIRAVLNYAAKMTTPFVKKAAPVAVQEAAPVAVQEAAPVAVQEAQAIEQPAEEPVAQESVKEFLEDENIEPSTNTYL